MDRRSFLKTAIARYRRKKLLDETPLRFELEMNKHKDAPLRFPGKLLAYNCSPSFNWEANLDADNNQRQH